MENPNGVPSDSIPPTEPDPVFDLTPTMRSYTHDADEAPATVPEPTMQQLFEEMRRNDVVRKAPFLEPTDYAELSDDEIAAEHSGG